MHLQEWYDSISSYCFLWGGYWINYENIFFRHSILLFFILLQICRFSACATFQYTYTAAGLPSAPPPFPGISWILDPLNLWDPVFQRPRKKNILGLKGTRFVFVPLPPQHRIENYNQDSTYLLLSLITTLVASQIVAGWSSQAFYSIKFR